MSDEGTVVHLSKQLADRDRRIAELEAAIRKHRDEKGDDRCWMDDETLYRTLPEGYSPPPRDSSVELSNCQRYIACRHNPATEYVSPQREIERLEAIIESFRNPEEPIVTAKCGTLALKMLDENKQLKSQHARLLVDLNRYFRELCADYPRIDKADAPEQLYALTESLKGVTLACDDLHKIIKELEAERDGLKTMHGEALALSRMVQNNRDSILVDLTRTREALTAALDTCAEQAAWIRRSKTIMAGARSALPKDASMPWGKSIRRELQSLIESAPPGQPQQEKRNVEPTP